MTTITLPTPAQLRSIDVVRAGMVYGTIKQVQYGIVIMLGYDQHGSAIGAIISPDGQTYIIRRMLP